MKLVTQNEKAWLDSNANSTPTPITFGTIVTANQSATIAALTDNSGGATADGTIGVVTAPDLSTWNGSSVFPTAAQATAIIAADTASRDAIKELSTKLNAVIAALKTAGIML